MLYVAIVVIAFLAHDGWKALWFTDAAGTGTFGISVGTLVLALNVTLLSGYTFGCHSLRHLVGARHLFQVVEEDRVELHGVAVAIHHRMVEPGADLRRCEFR